jgi:hypothetical protein
MFAPGGEAATQNRFGLDLAGWSEGSEPGSGAFNGGPVPLPQVEFPEPQMGRHEAWLIDERGPPLGFGLGKTEHVEVEASQVVPGLVAAQARVDRAEMLLLAPRINRSIASSAPWTSLASPRPDDVPPSAAALARPDCARSEVAPLPRDRHRWADDDRLDNLLSTSRTFGVVETPQATTRGVKLDSRTMSSNGKGSRILGSRATEGSRPGLPRGDVYEIPTILRYLSVRQIPLEALDWVVHRGVAVERVESLTRNARPRAVFERTRFSTSLESHLLADFDRLDGMPQVHGCTAGIRSPR